MSMFCYQCQEAARNTGCTVRGVCGKEEDVANLQDLLIHTLKGISFYGAKASEVGIVDPETDRFVTEGLFTTITNVNFDTGDLYTRVKEALSTRDGIREKFLNAYREKNGKEFEGELPDAATWHSDGTMEEFIAKGTDVGILATGNEDVRSLRELLIIGWKGIAAYADHASVLGKTDDGISAAMHEALAATTDDSLSADEFCAPVLCPEFLLT